MSPEWLPRLVVLFVLFLLFLSIRRRREAIRHAIRRIAFAEGAFIGVAYVLGQAGQPAAVSLVSGIAAALLVNQMIQGRSRHVPESVKRRKKAEYELRTGKKYNPKKFEMDHEIPFSRGGSHTEDNIRVVEKKRNRSKGNKSPWWDLLGR